MAGEKEHTKKLQSALDFLSTYIWALLIIAVVVGVIFEFLSIPQTSIPNTCIITYGASCQDLILTSSAKLSNYVILLSNTQPYPVVNPILSFNTSSGVNVATSCAPQYVLPGGDILCNASSTNVFSLGSLVSGTFRVNDVLCPVGNVLTCAPNKQENYVGSFNVHASPILSAIPVSITLTALNQTQPATGQLDPLTAHVSLLGYPLSGATVQFAANVSNVFLFPTLQDTGSNGNATSYISSNQSEFVRVNATFAGYVANTVIDFANPIVITFQTTPMPGASSQNPVLKVDGVSYTYQQLPKKFLFTASSQHTYQYYSAVPGQTGVQYVYGTLGGCGFTQQNAAFTAMVNCTVTAVYNNQYQLTMAVNPFGGGTTTPTVGNYWYNPGDQVTISATPNSDGGYTFVNWIGTGQGSYSGSQNSYPITMGGPVTETATFTQASTTTSSTTTSSTTVLSQYLLTVIYGQFGTTQNPYPQGTVVNVDPEANVPFGCGTNGSGAWLARFITGQGTISYSCQGVRCSSPFQVTMNSDITETIDYHCVSGTSFIAGTQIMLTNGTETSIEQIKPGYSILSYDTQTNKFYDNVVLKVINFTAYGEYLINGNIGTDANELFYTNGTWTSASDLNAGDKIYDPLTNTSITITSISYVPKSITVYDIIGSSGNNMLVGKGYLADAETQ